MNMDAPEVIDVVSPPRNSTPRKRASGDTGQDQDNPKVSESKENAVNGATPTKKKKPKAVKNPFSEVDEDPPPALVQGPSLFPPPDEDDDALPTLVKRPLNATCDRCRKICLKSCVNGSHAARWHTLVSKEPGGASSSTMRSRLFPSVRTTRVPAFRRNSSEIGKELRCMLYTETKLLLLLYTF